MGKPVAGEVVVFPFPQTNLQSGKRRPALVVADLMAVKIRPGIVLIADNLNETRVGKPYTVARLTISISSSVRP